MWWHGFYPLATWNLQETLHDKISKSVCKYWIWGTNTVFNHTGFIIRFGKKGYWDTLKYLNMAVLGKDSVGYPPEMKASSADEAKRFPLAWRSLLHRDLGVALRLLPFTSQSLLPRKTMDTKCGNGKNLFHLDCVFSTSIILRYSA